MLALSMIAIVVVAVYKMQHDTIAMNNAARFHTTAPLLALKKMSEIGGKSLNEVADESGGFGEDFPGYGWNIAVAEVESEELGTVAERLKKIDVSVFSGEGKMTYQLRLYKFFND